MNDAHFSAGHGADSRPLMDTSNPYDDNPAKRRAWTEGYEDYTSGVWVDDNPYDPLDHLGKSKAWVHGWFAAYEKREGE